MGVYLVPFALDRLDEMGDGTGVAQVDAALVQAGLPGLGSVTGEGDGFEEKLIADPTSFVRLVDELAPQLDQGRPPVAAGASAHAFPASVADVWLPIEFSGLVVVPGVTGIYQAELTVASSVDIARQLEALAAALDFPLASVPQLAPEGYVINDWHEEMERSDDPRDPVWRRDPDIAFYLAVFWAAARYSVEHNTAVAYG